MDYLVPHNRSYDKKGTSLERIVWENWNNYFRS
jgi:hypothetical protein